MNRLQALLPRRYGLHVEASQCRVADLRAQRWLGAWPDPGEAVQALASLAAPVWRRDTVDIVLADTLARPVALARPRGIRSVAELQAAHRGRFDAMFGGDETWRLRIQPQSPATPAHEAIDVVVGVLESTLGPVERLCQRLRWRPRTMRPQWLAWADRWSSHWHNGEHWLVVADGASTTVAYLAHGRCLSVRQQRGSRLPLADLLAREAALVPHHQEAASVWVAGTGQVTDLAHAPRQVSAMDWWLLGETAVDPTAGDATSEASA